MVNKRPEMSDQGFGQENQPAITVTPDMLLRFSALYEDY